MTPEQWNRCKRIFGDALDLDTEERIDLLDRECAADPELRAEVVKLLGGLADDASPIDVGAADRVLASQPAEMLIPGDTLGRYKVIRRIGQGGTSLVYLAEHIGLRTPRRFAIKVIAAAFLAGNRERFDRECQILATLEHPNIARIEDLGVTESGWPYLVMDYVEGAPIQKYCAEHGLAPPEIARLIIECCRAVSYFHRNAVVHCDLKPANILIDATGSPRILDFGIARLVEPDRLTRTGQTTRGIRPLTPDYASPEQLSGSPLAPVTDIYSLGVVFYETLTGSLPFPDFTGLSWNEMSRRMAEQSPAQPSKSAARLHGVRVARQMRGDLDAVVLKALAYDPAQRYASAELMESDLRRYLAGESVAARRSDWGEDWARTVHRRRRGVIEVVLAMILIALVLSLSAWRTRRAETAQEQAYVDELRGILQPIILTSSAHLPESTEARNTLIDQVSRTISIVAAQIRKHPDLTPDLTEALIDSAALLGNPYEVNLGRLDDARSNYQRAFDLARDETGARFANFRARSAVGIGDTYSHPGFERDPEEAIRWYRLALSPSDLVGKDVSGAAATAHVRLAMTFELLGDLNDAREEYQSAGRIMPAVPVAAGSLESAIQMTERAAAEPAEKQGDMYNEALGILSRLLQTDPHNPRVWHTAVSAHLFAGLKDVRMSQPALAEAEFAAASGLSQQILFRDPDDRSTRRDLAIALRREAMVRSLGTNSSEDGDLRAKATSALSVAMPARTDDPPNRELPGSCPNSAEGQMQGSSTTPLRQGNLLLGNRGASGAIAALLEFAPESREMNIIAPHGYISNLVDVAPASGTEVYIIDGESQSIVRLRHAAGGWFHKQLSCGGFLRVPVSIAWGEHRLVVADSDRRSLRFIEINSETGQQRLIVQSDTFAVPGKLVHSGRNRYYISLYWSGEAGPAEIAALDSTSGKLTTVAQYGLLQYPIALGMTPAGSLLVGDREWLGGGGRGYILGIKSQRPGYNAQRVVLARPELARVTALTAVSEREAWYSTTGILGSPASHSQLFSADLATGKSREITMGDNILAASVTIARID